MEQPSFSRAIARGATLRCPRCGSGRLFRWWLVMVPDCPRCGLHFEREDGYWLGSMTLNLGITMALFMTALVGSLVLLWPDVPWTAVWIATVAVTIVAPLALHPFSRTIWVAAERHFRALSDGVY